MSNIHAIVFLEGVRLIPCITCTFLLEEKYQHEKSKNTMRIREMGFSSKHFGLCMYLRRILAQVKNKLQKRFECACGFRKLILILTVPEWIQGTVGIFLQTQDYQTNWKTRLQSHPKGLQF